MKLTIRNIFKTLLLTAILIVLVCAGGRKAPAQSISLFDIDTGKYPDMSANIYVYSASGEPLDELEASSLQIIDNSQSAEFSIDCPQKSNPVPLSVVLTFDISGSMAGTGLKNTKIAAREFIRNFPSDISECAITSFNDLSYLNKDFTNDKQKLLDAVNSLYAIGGTNYNAGFLGKYAGGLNVLQKGNNKRILVFLTDGVTQGNEQEIIQKALSINAEVYAICLDIKAPVILRNIAERTGGRVFDGLKTDEDLKNVYRNILNIALGNGPCKVSWKSSGCNRIRSLEVKYFGYPSYSTAYSAPEDKMPAINYSPKSLSFGIVDPQSGAVREIELTAKNDSIFIHSISVSDPRFVITDYGGENPPFTLKKDSSRTISVKFTPPDSGYYFSRFEIIGNVCGGRYFYAAGGKEEKSKDNFLKVEFPNGLERLTAGIDTLLVWSGVLPEEKVWLQFSSNSGRSWIDISKEAQGLAYRWRLPDINSFECLLRVRKLNASSDGKVTILAGHGNSVQAVAWSPDGKLLAGGSDNGTIKLWEISSASEKLSVNNDLRPVRDLCWSPDGRYLISSGQGDLIKFWNPANGELADSIDEHSVPVNSIQCDNSGDFLAAGDDSGRLVLYSLSDLDKVKEIQIFDFGNAVTDLEWSADDLSLAVGSVSGEVKILNSDDLEIVFNAANYDNAVTSVSLSPENGMLAVSANGAEVYIWDAVNSLPLDTLAGHSGRVLEVAWNHGSGLLATAGTDETVILWDNDFNVFYSYSGHSDGIISLKWSKDGKYIASGSYDTNIEVWSPDDIPLEDPLIQEDESDLFWFIVQPEISARDIDLGSAPVGFPKDTIIQNVISNTGSEDAVIDSISINGNEKISLVNDPSPFVIPARQNRSLEFRFDPGDQPGNETSQMTIYSRTDTLVHQVKASSFTRDITLLNPLIDFGILTIGNEKDSLVHLVENDNQRSFIIDSIVRDGINGVQFVIPDLDGSKVLASGDTLSLDITFSPDAQARFNENLRIYFQGKGSPLTVRLFGEGADYELLYEPSIDFPEQECEYITQDTVISVINSDQQLITISSATLVQNNDYFSLSHDQLPVTLNQGEQLDFNVRFSSGDLGTKTARLEFVSNIEAGDSRNNFINISGHIEKFEFSLSENTIDFGILNENEEASATFSITNAGTKPLEFNTPVALDHFEIISIVPNIIPPFGGKALATVEFPGRQDSDFYEDDYFFTDPCGNTAVINFIVQVSAEKPHISSIPQLNFDPLICSNIPRDTTITIRNTGSDDLLIRSASTEGQNAAEFLITGIVDNLSIDPGSSDEISLRFKPEDTGIRSTTLVLMTNAENAVNERYEVILTGEKQRVSFDLSDNMIDFGIVKVDESATATFSIVNNGTIPVTWNYPIRKGKFEIVDILPLETPSLGGESIATVVFDGGPAGEIYEETFEFTDICGNTKSIDMAAEIQAPAWAVLKAGDICGFPGDTVSLPVFVNYQENLDEFEVNEFEVTLTYDADFMVPVESTPSGTIVDGQRIIDLKFPAVKNNGRYEYEFDFIVSWTLKDSADLVLSDGRTDNKYVGIGESPGKFDMGCGTNILSLNDGCYCEDVNSGDICQSMEIYQSFPNPARQVVTIEYDIFEAQGIELLLWYSDAQQVVVLDKGYRTPGNYQIKLDMSNLPAGMYVYILQSSECKCTCKLLYYK